MNHKNKIINIILKAILSISILCIFICGYNIHKISRNRKDIEALAEEYIGIYSDNLKNQGYYKKDKSKSASISINNISNNKRLQEIDCVIAIPDIDVKSPVFTGKNRQNYLNNFMYITGYEKNTYGLGPYYIFGHQSKTYGYSFNRLNELQTGSEIQIYKQGVIYNYKVSQITKTWEMSIDKQDLSETSTIFIYTCVKSKSKTKPYILVEAQLQK